jgi:hypothetical protein
VVAIRELEQELGLLHRGCAAGRRIAPGYQWSRCAATSADTRRWAIAEGSIWDAFIASSASGQRDDEDKAESAVD